MRKYSEKFEKDFNFYLNNKDKFKFAGIVIDSFKFVFDGADAKLAFWTLDSKGKEVPCSEPELLREILICKKAINLQILMWAEGQDDCWIPISELLESFKGEIPEWVEKAIRNQIAKSMYLKYG